MKQNGFINKHYGMDDFFYRFKVSFYEGGEKEYKNGAAADKFARNCALEGKYCELLGLTSDGWKHICCC